MLPALVGLALAAFVAALLGSLHAGRIVTLHLILAVGAMPLIFGAMGHFIPVLTRTRTPGAGMACRSWHWRAGPLPWLHSASPTWHGGVTRAHSPH